MRHFLCGLFLAVFSAGCSPASLLGVGPISELAREYTGALQISPTVPEGSGETPSLGTVDILHKVNVTKESEVMLAFESPAIPRFKAVVVNVNESAANLDFLAWDSTSGLAVKELAFVKNEKGTWLLLLQFVNATEAKITQFASYDPSEATPGEQEAIRYIDFAFDLLAGRK